MIALILNNDTISFTVVNVLLFPETDFNKRKFYLALSLTIISLKLSSPASRFSMMSAGEIKLLLKYPLYCAEKDSLKYIFLFMPLFHFLKTTIQ